MRQSEFKFRTWGGKRRRAGAKPKGERAGVKHDPRPVLKSRFPVHVNVKLRERLISLRQDCVQRPLLRVFRAANKPNFRLVHYSIQTNHMHFLVEAEDAKALSRGMQGLMVRMARALNHLMKRSGKVFADRYYAEILTSPRQTKHALHYVLRNHQRHSNYPYPPDWRDPFASTLGPLTTPGTWLLSHAPLPPTAHSGGGGFPVVGRPRPSTGKGEADPRRRWSKTARAPAL